MTQHHEPFADLLLAAENFGLTNLPRGYWQLSPCDRAAAGRALLADLRKRSEQGDESARQFLTLPWGSPHDLSGQMTIHRNATEGVPYSALSQQGECVDSAQLISEFIESLSAYPAGYSGRGIVTCAGGPTYQTCAWVLFTMLRKLGCTLPIECWYAGSGERDAAWQRWVAEEFGVTCIDAVARDYVGHRFATPPLFRGHKYPPGTMHGYALKPFAVLHSSFREVLFLDADNTPERDPTFLLDSPEFRAAGSIFWPDLPDCTLTPDLAAFGVFDEPEPSNWESGQIVLDKARTWRPLVLTNWFNAQAPYFYQHSWGDCGTWQAGWRRLAAPFAVPAFPARRAGEVALVQHDFDGQPLFFHRVGRRGKWRLTDSEPTPGYSHNRACLAALKELSQRVAGGRA